MKSFVVILFINKELAAWTCQSAGAAIRQPLLGQSVLKVLAQNTLSESCTDLAERMRGEGFVPDAIHWLIDHASRDLLPYDSLQICKATDQRPAWQVLSWEWVTRRFGLLGNPLQDGDGTLQDLVFPWLIASNHDAEYQQLQETLAREHQSEAERLANERRRLQQENEQLRAQNNALQQVDAENLLRFLPALFPRVFTVLGASDLALLCGRVEPLAIPNPYPEPSGETLRALQRKFRSLPHHTQAQIVQLITGLPHRQQLQLRPEMRELVQDLERG